jgi:hypothetical protein
MSRQFRYRVAALMLGGLLLGVPLLASGTASAEQLDESGRQLTFSGGGMLGLSCRSQPDVESLTVPANSTVRVVNRTGHDANLKLAGQTKGMLPENQSTQVVFRRGTTAVTLTPDCLDGDSTPVQVTASPSLSATTPDPIPAPSTGDSSAFAATTSDSSGPANSQADAQAPAPRPSRPAAPAGKPPSVRVNSLRSAAIARAATAAAQAMPQGGDASKIKVKGAYGTRSSTEPAFSGMPLGEKKALLPGVPKLDAVPPAPAAVASPGVTETEVAAAEPVAAMQPIQRGGPVGLLALIAAVCVLGVGTATIRAIVSQRANPGLMA